MDAVDIHLLATDHHRGGRHGPCGVVESKRRLAEADRSGQPLVIADKTGGHPQSPLIHPVAVDFPLQRRPQPVVAARCRQRDSHRPTFCRGRGQEIKTATPLLPVDVGRQRGMLDKLGTLPEIRGREIQLKVMGLLADPPLDGHGIYHAYRKPEELSQALGLLYREIKHEVIGGHEASATRRAAGLPLLQVAPGIGREQRRKRLRHYIHHSLPKKREIKLSQHRAVEPVALQVEA